MGDLGESKGVALWLLDRPLSSLKPRKDQQAAETQCNQRLNNANHAKQTNSRFLIALEERREAEPLGSDAERASEPKKRRTEKDAQGNNEDVFHLSSADR